MAFGIYAGIIIFFLGIIIGLPLGWTFLTSSVATLAFLNIPSNFMASTFYHSFESYTLMAIASFILAGSLIAESGIAEKLVAVARIIVGKIRGGMVGVGIVSTLMFSALTGSSVPCIAALAPVLVGPLEKYGYERKYTTAVLCCSSFLGYLIPPSVPVMFYCLIAHQSVAAVFLSTIIPGLLITGGYLLLNYLISDNYRHQTTEEISMERLTTIKDKFNAIWSAMPVLMIPVIVFVGIYGGICTSNEVGAIILFYTLIVGAFIYRTLNNKIILSCTKDTIITLGMTFTLLAFGTVFARVLTREGVPQLIAKAIIGFSDNKLVTLLMINVLLLIMGMFIDGIPILVIVVPMIMPLVSNLDINLVHLGAIIVLNIGIGVVTPPFAVSIFVGSKIANVPYAELVKPMMLYLFIVALPVLLLTTFIPALSCWLPTLIMGSKIVGSW